MKQVMEILFENRSSPVGQSAEKAMYLHGTRGQQQAALRQILKEYIHQKPDATPIVLQAERVTDFFITAVSAGMTGEYRAVLSRCALLVITDLEFIQGRTQVAEFILEILEYRKRRNLPTLLTGTCPPEALLNHTGHNGALPCRSIPLP